MLMSLRLCLFFEVSGYGDLSSYVSSYTVSLDAFKR